MNEPKRVSSDLQKEAERLIAAGKMPSLEELLKAIGDTREKYRNAILEARAEGPDDSSEESDM